MPAKESFPVVPWPANNKHLIRALFTVLQENRGVRKGIWPPVGEVPSAAIRAGSCKVIATILLKDEASIKDFLKDPNASACYGTAIDNQITRLERTWGEARDILGTTRARPVNRDSLEEGTDAIRGKWDEAKKICPWFFIMRDIMEDRVQDVDIGMLEVVTNSETDVYLSPPQRGDRKRRRRDTETEHVQDDDIVENAEVQAVGKSNTSLVAFNETPYTDVARYLLTPMQEAWSSLDIDSPERTEYYELGEALKQVGAMRHERKRLQAAAKEETERVKIRERFALEKVRLETKHGVPMRKQALDERKQALEERKMALEERKLALQERQIGMGQTR